MSPRRRAAIVFGGDAGLGIAVARRFAERGVPVVLAGERTETARSARSVGAVFEWVDPADEGSVRAAADVATALGDLRGAVSCVGTSASCRLLDRSGLPHGLDEFQNLTQTIITGTFNVMRLVAQRMAHNAPDENGERGVVVTTSSIAATDGQAGQVAYAAAKGAVSAMTLPAARDLAPMGIRVCSIAPGLFATDDTRAMTPARIAALEDLVPHPRRFGRPVEFAELVMHLVDNPYINGEVVRADAALRLAAR